MNILHYDTVENVEYDAPAIVFAGNSYYLRFNDPKEFLDVPYYPGAWQNLDNLERDRRIHIVHTPAVNGFNLDYATDWFPEESEFKALAKTDDEGNSLMEFYFGKSGITVVIDRYSLIYETFLGGYITGIAYQLVNAQDDASEVEAHPLPDYEFYKWSDLCTINPRQDKFVIMDVDVSAVFDDATKFFIYLPTRYWAGSDYAYSTFNGEQFQTEGTAITAVVPDNHRFLGWSDESFLNPRTDTDSVTVYPLFELDLYTIIYWGVGPQIIEHGMDGSAAAITAPEGETFKGWLHNGSLVSTDNPHTELNVTDYKEYFPLFETSVYTVNYTAGPGITLTGALSQELEHGETGEPVCADDIVTWSDGLLADSHYVVRATENKDIVAYNAYTHGVAIYHGTNGTFSGDTVQIVTYNTSGDVITAVPDEGYEFAVWSDGIETTSRRDHNIIGATYIEAIFQRKSYTLDYLSAGNGSISGQANQIIEHNFSGTSVQAIPDEGYVFDEWSDGYKRDIRKDVKVTENLEFMASFKVREYNVQYIGTLEGVAEQIVAHGENSTEVTVAVPAGHEFVKWSDGETTNPRRDVNVTSDIYVIAEIRKQRFILNYLNTEVQLVEYNQSGSEVECTSETFYGWSDGVLTAKRTDDKITDNLFVLPRIHPTQEEIDDEAADIQRRIATLQQALQTYDVAEIQEELGIEFTPEIQALLEERLQALLDSEAMPAFHLATYEVNGNGYILGERIQEIREGGNSRFVRALPNPGWRFVSWSDDNTEDTRFESGMTSDVTLTANFEEAEYTITYEVIGTGTLEGELVQTLKYGEDSTPVIADAPVTWSDGTEGLVHQITDVTRDHVIHCSFNEDTFIVYIAGDHGSFEDGAKQIVLIDSEPITAIPNSGFIFSEWSDGSKAPTREDVSGEYTAYFIPRYAIVDTKIDLVPGDLILRDERFSGTLSGHAGDFILNVDGLEEEISDKRITTEVPEVVDTGIVLEVAATHIVTDLFEASNYVSIGGKFYTVFSYSRGNLYLVGDISEIEVGETIETFETQEHLPLSDNDWSAWASGSELRVGDETHWVLDHYPNARSEVTGLNDQPMFDLTDWSYQDMDQHPEPIVSRFLPEVWQRINKATRKIRLQTPLEQDYVNAPFTIVNKQWYVASVECLKTLPKGHEPKCFQILRIGGQDLPYRLRRFVFPNWDSDRLEGDIIYAYGPQFNPPYIDSRWEEDEEGHDICQYPNWYQEMEYGATFTRVLTVKQWQDYESMGDFGDMFVCELNKSPYSLLMPSIDESGLTWTKWDKKLYQAGMHYV